MRSPCFHVAYGFAHCDDGAGELVSGDVRHCDVGVVALPSVPIGAAEPGCANHYNDAVRGRRWIGYVD